MRDSTSRSNYRERLNRAHPPRPDRRWAASPSATPAEPRTREVNMTDAPTIFITGATDGLGRALAHRLAADGANLILHGRDAGQLELTADDIGTAHGVDRPRTVRADLAELAQVRKLALDVQDATDRLDVFVSNAGIGGGMPDGRDRRTSADGYELRF